jgi:hypothetical protein
MKTLSTIAVAALLLAGCASSGGLPTHKAYSNAEIIAMSKDKRPAEVIEILRTGGAAYELTAVEIVDLAKQGVSPDVLNYMHQTHIAAARQEEQADLRWSRWGAAWGTPWGSYWGAHRYYRQPRPVIVVPKKTD